MSAIDGSGIFYGYDFEESGKFALEDITINIKKGEFAAVLGHNGCGKSTLARHFNGLLPLQEGKLSVLGSNVREEKNLYKLRRQCGMVFQNPDNQFVSSIVEEDIAFGLENYDTPKEDIPDKVKSALGQAGMEGFEKRMLYTLSGGQKQRIALAGVLAVEPDIIVFDEATSMLDPKGRSEVLNSMKRLHNQGKTIVMITHYVEEAILADTVFVMKEGQILANGAPREILTDCRLLQQAGLVPPAPVRLYNDLAKDGIYLPYCPLTNEELVEELCRLN